MTHYLHALPDEAVTRALRLLSLLGGDEELTGMGVQGMSMSGKKTQGKGKPSHRRLTFPGFAVKGIQPFAG